MAVNKELLDLLVCPKCKGEIEAKDDGSGLACGACKLLFPIEDPLHRRYLRKVLELQLKDNVNARELQPNDRYLKVVTKGKTVDSQQAIFDLTRELLCGQGKREPQREFIPIGRPREEVQA